jgi:hypothetical protein
MIQNEEVLLERKKKKIVSTNGGHGLKSLSFFLDLPSKL